MARVDSTPQVPCDGEERSVDPGPPPRQQRGQGRDAGHPAGAERHPAGGHHHVRQRDARAGRHLTGGRPHQLRHRRRGAFERGGL
eukprot:6186968-Pyramimonas_sp.AAC.1